MNGSKTLCKLRRDTFYKQNRLKKFICNFRLRLFALFKDISLYFQLFLAIIYRQNFVLIKLGKLFLLHFCRLIACATILRSTWFVNCAQFSGSKFYVLTFCTILGRLPPYRPFFSLNTRIWAPARLYIYTNLHL